MSLDPEYIMESYKNLTQDKDFYYLYKHIAIDSEMGVFGIFTNNQLKYNYPGFFNDPFDCLFDITINIDGFNKEEFEKFIGKEIPNEVWDVYSTNIKKNLNDKDLFRKHVNKLRNEMLSITCFNSNPLSILMWSHYANNHQGMLLEFKFPRKDAKLFPIPVFYDDEYQTINASWRQLVDIDPESEFILDITRTTIFRKSTEWSYEKEFRLIGNSQSNPQMPLLQNYPPEYLSSVIMGAKLEDTTVIQKLKSEVENFNKKHSLQIEIFKSQLKEGHYLLEVPNHPRLG